MIVAFLNGSHIYSINNRLINDLKEICNKYGDSLYNFGVKDEKVDLSYVEVGILTSLLINSGAVDFVITGCTSGQGVNIVSNSFPNVISGHIENKHDAMSFIRVNDGNAVSIPFSDELDIDYHEIFDTLLKEEKGGGYPESRKEYQKLNRDIINNIRNKSFRPYIDILKDIDINIIKKFKSIDEFNQFYDLATDKEIKEYIELLK